MATKDKLFTSPSFVKTGIYSRKRMNREYMLSKTIASDLNTYKNFGIFPTYNDIGDGSGVNDDNTLPDYEVGTPGVRSIFNKYSATLTGNNSGVSVGIAASQSEQGSALNKLVNEPQDFRLNSNVPLMDSPETRKKLREMSGCSVKELVANSKKGYFGRSGYSYADFMYCKYLGRVPNNHLITLRRFPAPIGDSLMPFGVKARRLSVGRDSFYQPIGTMVTWLGVSDNDPKSILKYSYNMAFKEMNAKWEQVQEIGGGKDGILNKTEALFNPVTRRAFQQGYTTEAGLGNFMSSFFGFGSEGSYSYNDGSRIDANKVYGPIDRVKKTYMRGEDGLDWDQTFTLNFDYELRSYNGINPRAAMLDLIASIMSVTYTTGGFWGGGYRGGGMRQSSTFANLNIFQASGGFTDYMNALQKDLEETGILGQAVDLGNQLLSNPIDTIKRALNAIGGMLFGGLLNQLGRPKRYFANSLLSEAPVGLWHITIGNPNHPIMTLGNMILKKTTIEHSGPLGLDDFPTNLRVTCEFSRGKPRDQAQAEAIYLHGNDRIFHSMSKHLDDMYKAAVNYKSGTDSETASISEGGDIMTSTTESTSSEASVSSVTTYMTEVFGSLDENGSDAAIITAREQAEGGFKATSTESTSESNGTTESST